ncbi:hypothetical protein NPIL_561171 [Nephila pilipes]|uniref:Uncharacterized protein n=1 Tax=Nephila pilipes TaxID=299642 RepID=A0A8X6T417_NEPPI|nr:hypothetical protein NPIL_561171 [Nephila pilipes]
MRMNALGLQRNFRETLPYPLSVEMSHSKFGEIIFFQFFNLRKITFRRFFWEKGIFEREGNRRKSSAFWRGRAAPAKEKSPVAASTAARRRNRKYFRRQRRNRNGLLRFGGRALPLRKKPVSSPRWRSSGSRGAVQELTPIANKLSEKILSIDRSDSHSKRIKIFFCRNSVSVRFSQVPSGIKRRKGIFRQKEQTVCVSERKTLLKGKSRFSSTVAWRWKRGAVAELTARLTQTFRKDIIH